MTPFSPGERHTVEGFARQLGLDARMAADGTFSFVFQSTGTLTLTPSGDGTRTIVSLSSKVGRVDGDVLHRALRRTGQDDSRGRLLHAGLAPDESLFFMTCLGENEISLPMLEDCLQQLKAALDAVR